MFSVFFVLALGFSLVVSTFWPLPQSLSKGSGSILLCNNFEFTSNVTSSDILNDAIQRFYDELKTSNTNSHCVNSGLITVGSSSENLSYSTDESYTLNISSTHIIINSESIYGSMYGLTTLLQSIVYNESTSTNNIYHSPISIYDYPYYKYRGVMIDTARNWISVNSILNILYGMSLVKLNIFHWHITDATSWPFYSKSHPELSLYGSYGNNKVYYSNDINKIINYGKSLGIHVIPEFDTPGHSYSITYGDPSLMVCNDINDQVSSNCPEPPCGYLDLENKFNKSLELILDVYNDAYDLFIDQYFHVGGDEVKNYCWGDKTQPLFINWFKNLSINVINNKRIPLIWSSNEIVNGDIGQYNNEIIMLIWDNSNDKLDALRNGFKVIDSIYTSYYLDCGTSSWLTGGSSWCAPYKSWTDIYNHSLVYGIPSTYYNNIYGGEICVWSEQVDDNNIETKIFPRAQAAAESWWTNKHYLLNNKYRDDTWERMAKQRDYMVKHGIKSVPLQPEYCTKNRQYCDYYRDSIFEQTINNNNYNFKLLLNKYKLNKFIKVFSNNGWDIIKYWNKININLLKEFGFKSGDIIKFNQLLKENNLL